MGDAVGAHTASANRMLVQMEPCILRVLGV